MNNNTIVTTLPLKPRTDMKVFHYLIPALVEQTGKLLNCKTNLMINNIGFYENLDIESFLNFFKQKNIKFDNTYIDKDYLDYMVSCIKKLIDEDKIIEKNVPIYRCRCGKVDIIKNGVRDFSSGDFYTIDDNNDITCSFCKSKAEEVYEKALIIDDPKKYFKPQVCPTYMEKMMLDLLKQREECYILVSKKRDTGISIKVGENNYNLDVDFVWANFPQIFNEKNVIIFTGSNLLYESFVVNLISNMHNEKNVFIVHQAKVLSNNKGLEDKLLLLDNDKLKLNMCFNINLKTYTTNWSEAVFNFLLNCDEVITNMLLKYPGYKIDFDENNLSSNKLENFIKFGFNFQFNKNAVLKLVQK